VSIFDLDNYTDAVSDAVDAISDAGDEIGGILKTVSPVLGMVPGIGTAFSVAVYAAGAVAAGDKITDALIGIASAAMPPGVPRVAFDGATNITKDVAEGRSVVDSTIKACRQAANTAGGAPAVAAFDSCISVMHGGKIDQRLIDEGREFYLETGGTTAAASYDAVVSTVQGNDPDQTVIYVSREYIKQVGGPIAAAAFDGGVALGHGKTLQEAGYIGLHTLVKGNDAIEKILNFVEQVGRAKNLKMALHQVLESDLAAEFLHTIDQYGGIPDSDVIDSTLGPYIDKIRNDPRLLEVASGDLAKQWNEGEAIIRQAQALLRSGDGTIDDAMLTNLKKGVILTFGSVPEKNVAVNDTYFQKGQSLIASGAKYGGKLISDILKASSFRIAIDQFDALNGVWGKRMVTYKANGPWGSDERPLTDAWRRGFTIALGACDGSSQRDPGQTAVYQTVAEAGGRDGFDAGQAVAWWRTIAATTVKASTATSSMRAGQVFTKTEVQASSAASGMRAAHVDPPGGVVLTAVISSTVSPGLQVGAQGIIYALKDNGDLLWYRHDGRGDGSFVWASDSGRRVGNGWDVKQVFSGGDGVIYALKDNGDLLWYRHDGRGDGRFVWAPGAGRRVGNGWDVKQAFSGGSGIIYALMDNGDLLWNRHDGRGDGSFVWASDTGRKVGSGWNVKQAFSGGSGVIYALLDNGDLLWNRHDGRGDGSFAWASDTGRKVGNGWDVKQAFSGDDGVIYALMDNGDLLWNRHDGRGDGSFVWASDQGRRVGNGWNVKQAFSG
jgi:hypothetical protein